MANSNNNESDIDINTLSTDPKYNFLTSFHNNDLNNNLFSHSEDESPYYNIDINSLYVAPCDMNGEHTNDLKILSINVQSLNAKFHELKDLIYELSLRNSQPDILCLQEIWQLPEGSEFKIEGYGPLIYRTRGDGVQGGGVGIYIRNVLTGIFDAGLSVFHDRIFESIFVELQTSTGNKIIVGSVYRPGANHPTLNVNQQFDASMDLLASLLDNLSSRNVPVFICGDINIDVLKYGNCDRASEYIDLLLTHGYLQSITLPTRCTNRSFSIIDHCIFNSFHTSITSYILTTLLSDHFPILHIISGTGGGHRSSVREFRDFSEANIAKFKVALQSMNWDLVLSCNDPQVAYDYFFDTFSFLYNLYFPLIIAKLKPKYHRKEPWFTAGLLVSRRRKIRLDKIAARTRKHNDIANYKKFRNLYNTVVRAAKKIYYTKQLQTYQANMKKTWQILYSAINKKPKKSQSLLHSLKIGERVFSDPLTIASKLNEFFSVAPGLVVGQVNPCGAGPEPAPNPEPDPAAPHFRSADLQVSHEEVYRAFDSLEPKKSLDFNNISMFFLKKCVDQILHPIRHIINLSFSTGMLPSQFKIAKVVPIFKSGDPRLPDNYRPIALLSNFSKVIEKVMHARLMAYLEEHSIITEAQFGFRPNHSTIHPLLHLDNFVTQAFNERKHVVAIFCDLRKAFDCVNHKILLNKLRAIGVGGWSWNGLKTT